MCSKLPTKFRHKINFKLVLITSNVWFLRVKLQWNYYNLILNHDSPTHSQSHLSPNDFGPPCPDVLDGHVGVPCKVDRCCDRFAIPKLNTLSAVRYSQKIIVHRTFHHIRLMGMVLPATLPKHPVNFINLLRELNTDRYWHSEYYILSASSPGIANRSIAILGQSL